MELKQGKKYKIKRTQDAFYGIKKKTIWIEGVYIGTNGHYCTFDLGNGREVDIATEHIQEKIKEATED